MQRSLQPSPYARSGYVRLEDQRTVFRDLYHYLLVASWPRYIATMLSVYLGANVLFALAYFWDAGGIDGARAGSFADCFFFSIQTMSTIGYGKMAPNSLWTNLLVTVEATTGLIGVAMATGLTFAKFSRPTARVMFSRNAVIAQRDGKRVLMFRMANERANQIVEAHIRLVALRSERTAEGEFMRRLVDLELARDNTPVFTISFTGMHTIDERSPLYGLTPAAMLEQELDLFVQFMGLDESFGQTVHARHVYAAQDVLCDRRFADMFTTDALGARVVDLTKFHEVLPVE